MRRLSGGRVQEKRPGNKRPRGHRTPCPGHHRRSRAGRATMRRLREFTRRFDRVGLGRLAVGRMRSSAAAGGPSPDSSRPCARPRTTSGASPGSERRVFRDFEIEIRPGVFAGQAVIPLARAGVYVPGGRYPLVSSLLMGAIPAARRRRPGDRRLHAARRGPEPSPTRSWPPPGSAASERSTGSAAPRRSRPWPTERSRSAGSTRSSARATTTSRRRSGAVSGDVGIDFVAGPTELLIVADRTRGSRARSPPTSSPRPSTTSGRRRC